MHHLLDVSNMQNVNDSLFHRTGFMATARKVGHGCPQPALQVQWAPAAHPLLGFVRARMALPTGCSWARFIHGLSRRATPL